MAEIDASEVVVLSINFARDFDGKKPFINYFDSHTSVRGVHAFSIESVGNMM